MAKIRWRNGEFTTVQETYEEVVERYREAVKTNTPFVVTLSEPNEITVNPDAVDFIRPA